MNMKVVASAVAIALLVAVVIGLVIRDDGSTEDDVDDGSIVGKWHLLYLETAKLVDGDENIILNARDCPMDSSIMKPDDKFMELEITVVHNHFFKGTIGNAYIEGSFNGRLLGYTASYSEYPNHTYSNSGVYEGDRIVLVSHQVGLDKNVHSVHFAVYIREGSVPVSPLDHRIDLNYDYEHVLTTFHSASDFKTGGNPKGTPMQYCHKYSISHSMISLFNILDRNFDIVGVQAVVPCGIDPDGNLFAIVVSNIDSEEMEYGLTGYARVLNGRMNIIQFTIPSTDFCFIEFEYNVPYNQGTSEKSVFITGKYTGEMNTCFGDGSSSAVKISAEFKQYDEAVYGFGDYDDLNFVWFGGFDGTNKLEFEVQAYRDGELILSGLFIGDVRSDGSIVLYGLMYNISKDVVIGSDCTLVPMG